MGQIAQKIVGSQAQGSLPSVTVTNPIEHNNMSVVIIKNGKTTKSPEDKSFEENHIFEVDLEITGHQKSPEEIATPKVVKKEKQKEPKHVIRLKYPPRPKKKDQHEENYENFLEMFKKLEINIPFSEAL